MLSTYFLSVSFYVSLLFVCQFGRRTIMKCLIFRFGMLHISQQMYDFSGSVRDETYEKEIDKYENQSEIHIYLIFHIFCQAVMGQLKISTKNNSKTLSK